MRKKLEICVLIVMVLLLNTACKGNQDNGNDVISFGNNGTEISKDDNSLIETKNGKKKTRMFTQEATIEQQVLFEKDGIKITADKMIYSKDRAVIQVEVENSTDKKVTVSSGKWSAVNRYNGIRAYFYCRVDAGEKETDQISFAKEDLLEFGITDIAEMAISFEAEDDSYEDLFETDAIILRTSIYDTYDFEEDTLSKAIDGIWENDLDWTVNYKATNLNNVQDDIKFKAIAIVKLEEKSAIAVEIENMLDYNVKIHTSNISLNKIALNGGYWDRSELNAGYRGELVFDLDNLVGQAGEIIDIENLGCMSFQIEVEDELGNEISQFDVNFTFDKNQKYNYEMENEIYKENGLSIVSYPISRFGDEKDYAILLFVKNESGDGCWLDDDYGTMMINGKKVSYRCRSIKLIDGEYGIIPLTIDSSDASKIQVNDVDDIKNLQIKLRIYDNEREEKIGNPTISITY